MGCNVALTQLKTGDWIFQAVIYDFSRIRESGLVGAFNETLNIM
jgi:hypothetical protein